MKIKRFHLILVLCAVALVVPALYAMAASEFFSKNTSSMDIEKHLVIVNKKGEKHSFDVDLALNKEDQAKGLMFVTDMPMGSGMLFLFKTDQERSFWMKNTFIPLDIIFIEHDGKIQHIHSMATPQDTAHITSGKPSRAVLEINGGVADRLGIEPGDIVYHTVFNNTHLSP